MRRILALFLTLMVVFGLPLLAGCGQGDEPGSADADSSATGELANADSEDDTGDADGDEDEEEDEDDEDPKKPKKPKREKATTVNVSEVSRGDLIIPVVAEGTIRARNQAEVTTEIAGRIERLYVEEGQRVKRGQALVKVDDRDYQIALTEARSRYLEAVGKLAVDGRGKANPEAVTQLEGEIAELDKQLAKRAITKDEHDRQVLDLQVKAVQAGAYREELLAVRSGLAQARADVERAELNLEHTLVTAPFSGVVTGIGVASGERVSANARICDVVDNQNIEAVVAVLESDLVGLETGRPALLEVPAVRDTLLVRIDVISPEIDTDSRTCEVLMRFESEGGRIRPGMYARTAIAGEIHRDKLLVPREAILTRDGRPMLFKVTEDRAEWVYVRLGLANDRFVEIERVLQGGPLDPGTMVVVSDHLTLTHQAKVKVRDVVTPLPLWAQNAADN